MKKEVNLLVLFLLFLMSGVSAMAEAIHLNGGQYSLPECGGTIEVIGGPLKSGSSPHQFNEVNLIIRDTKNCSRYVMENSNQVYNLKKGHNSYIINLGVLHAGWNQINLIVKSDNRWTHNYTDAVTVWMNVEN